MRPACHAGNGVRPEACRELERNRAISILNDAIRLPSPAKHNRHRERIRSGSPAGRRLRPVLQTGEAGVPPATTRSVVRAAPRRELERNRAIPILNDAISLPSPANPNRHRGRIRSEFPAGRRDARLSSRLERRADWRGERPACHAGNGVRPVACRELERNRAYSVLNGRFSSTAVPTPPLFTFRVPLSAASVRLIAGDSRPLIFLRGWLSLKLSRFVSTLLCKHSFWPGEKERGCGR